MEEENKERGSFIRNIIKDLKECTNRMKELNFLTLKASYWWDKLPFKRPSNFSTQDYNEKKPLLIDRRYRSLIYDRGTISSLQDSTGSELFKSLTSNNTLTSEITDRKKFVNSRKSVQEKIKFFENRDVKDITPIAGGILYYGLSLNAYLDTYPSVYQFLKAAKTLKYDQEKATFCTPSSQSLTQITPSALILEDIINIQKKNYFQRFSNQNHPLSKIIQDHIQKLKYKAENKYFKEITKEEYKPSILYHKIITQMGHIIELMSAFVIDMDKGICEIPEFNNKSSIDLYYLYVQFYEVFNDLLFLLMSVENGYTQKDFSDFLTKTYLNRFDVLKNLSKDQDILVASYPMRSGMDAFANASMAIGHAPQDISIAPKVAHLENTVYYEISELLKNYPNRGETQSILFLSESTTPAQAELIITKIKQIFINLNVDNKLKSSESVSDFTMEEFTKNFLKAYSNGKAMVEEMSVKNNEQELNILKDKVKNLLFDLIEKEKPNNKNNIRLMKNEKDNYIIVPHFIMDPEFGTLGELFKNLIESFPNFIESRATVDKHYSMTSGMTTDTVDPSGDPIFIDKLYKKINNIRSLKQNWNPTPEPFIILWDTTMEVDQGPCYSLMNKFFDEIKAGKVVFILFKSLQKYANLGIGKSRAGVTTLVGKKEITLQKLHEKLTQAGQDVFSQSQEYALMTFFHDRFENDSTKPLFQDNEKLYYEAVRKHAQDIKQNNPNDDYQISGGCLFTPRKGDGKFPYADTFGFAIPTETLIESGIYRISVGLDPKGLR